MMGPAGMCCKVRFDRKEELELVPAGAVAATPVEVRTAEELAKRLSAKHPTKVKVTHRDVAKV